MVFPAGYHTSASRHGETEPSPIKKAVAAFRQRIAIGNRHLGRRMRYCGSCAVGVGLMTRKEYAARCVWREKVCPRCGEIVHIGGG